MPLPDDLVRHGRHVMAVCNACRYCEAYCPVFPAMERRRTFTPDDLAYLANLCHNCGECLYACQYAPPHEFGINVPRTLAEIRLASYEDACAPAWLSRAFRQPCRMAAAAVAVGVLAAGLMLEPTSWANVRAADFYQVISHGTMVGVFGVVAVAVLASFVAGRMRFRGGAGLDTSTAGIVPALGDGLTLRYLHATGADCSSAEETRRPWRRWFHHLTLYGFLLCFASTTVAAIYHLVFGWRAPYALTSAPVVLGLAGGIGLLVGPPGLFALRRQRDPALGDPAQRDLDASFIALLWLTAATGLLLLAMRDGRAMPALLVVHLAIVLALFLTLPYGKFVHGVYRMMALARFAAEERR